MLTNTQLLNPGLLKINWSNLFQLIINTNYKINPQINNLRICIINCGYLLLYIIGTCV